MSPSKHVIKRKNGYRIAKPLCQSMLKRGLAGTTSASNANQPSQVAEKQT